MLSIDTIREAMGRPELSDEETTEIRNCCHIIAESIVESIAYQHTLKQTHSSPFLEVPNVPMSTKCNEGPHAGPSSRREAFSTLLF